MKNKRTFWHFNCISLKHRQHHLIPVSCSIILHDISLSIACQEAKHEILSTNDNHTFI